MISFAKSDYPLLIRCPACGKPVTSSEGQDEPRHLQHCRCGKVFVWEVVNGQVVRHDQQERRVRQPP